MSFTEIISDLIDNTWGSMALFEPELALCVTIVVMLLLRVFDGTRRIDSFWVALAGSFVALLLVIKGIGQIDQQTIADGVESIKAQTIFTEMLVYDSMTVFFRGLLMSFAVLFVIFTKISGIPDREDAADFYCLVLGSIIGMCLMVSANHLLIVFLGIEMASVPSYVLVGMLRDNRKSSEASLKYVIFGAGTAGVMLYGISLLAGVLGSVHIPTMARNLAILLQASGDALPQASVALALGGLMLMVGLAFKLSAVPFHFWCPDVFEGASAEVNAFLSVASKAAAMALLIRVAIGFSYISDLPQATIVEDNKAAATSSLAPEPGSTSPVSMSLMSVTEKSAAKDSSRRSLNIALEDSRSFIVMLVGFLAMLTCTFGNLAAYAQTNVKRLMAYSSIAHAGYMMMAVAAAVHLSGVDTEAARSAVASLILYMSIYFFMNLGTFAIIAFLRNARLGEEIRDYAGLVYTSPGLAICFVVILMSLIGMPPLGGFVGKFRIFAALYDAGSRGSPWLLFMLAVGGINTAISLYYYLRLAKTMTIDEPPEDRLPVAVPITSPGGVFVVLMTLPVVGLGIWWDTIHTWVLAAASGLMG
ncbi:MAG: NADH-quinone oxidoreductase subunit N [Planctomycetes bacterium]|nr:NADH-quinone oxidoreductase subunit N [Planctomycetota bacterium]